MATRLDLPKPPLTTESRRPGLGVAQLRRLLRLLRRGNKTSPQWGAADVEDAHGRRERLSGKRLGEGRRLLAHAVAVALVATNNGLGPKKAVMAAAEPFSPNTEVEEARASRCHDE